MSIDGVTDISSSWCVEKSCAQRDKGSEFFILLCCCLSSSWIFFFCWWSLSLIQLAHRKRSRDGESVFTCKSLVTPIVGLEIGYGWDYVLVWGKAELRIIDTYVSRWGLRECGWVNNACVYSVRRCGSGIHRVWGVWTGPSSWHGSLLYHQ